MISLICPSRNRPNELKTAVDSLELKHDGPEVLVWVDDDDPQLNKYHELFDRDANVKLFVKKRVGYKQFHVMANFLCQQARFDWILEWNDDATMANPQWLVIFGDFVRQFDAKKQPVVINIWGQGEDKANLFPLVSRSFVEILGHFSLAPPCDEWVRLVATGANISYNLNGIKPKHRKYGGEDPLRDQTFVETERDRAEVKKTWNERRGILPQELHADISRIAQYKHDHKISSPN